MADSEIQPQPEPTSAPRPLRPTYQFEDEDFLREPDAIQTLIPYTNPRALTAYYLGVFSLIPALGLILGPLALILGVLGLRYGRAHASAGGVGHAITGIVLGSATSLFNGVLFVGILALVIAAFLR